MATVMLPPSAAHVLPVTMPTEQIEKREKLRSNSWIWPVSLTSSRWGSCSAIVPFSESEEGTIVSGCESGAMRTN